MLEIQELFVKSFSRGIYLDIDIFLKEEAITYLQVTLTLSLIVILINLSYLNRLITVQMIKHFKCLNGVLLILLFFYGSSSFYFKIIKLYKYMSFILYCVFINCIYKIKLLLKNLNIFLEKNLINNYLKI